ncbi:hypothetical protein [Gimesia aquarii]|uniref:Uncharacterized protein n=1 Tax=Gimesia aquarii TaxID=2527964 RepID=A0A517X1P9_9PLAN|nr:hypothetical protein [Gimesia aquarii]QDU11435.1 hypothetical protein V202x_48570 [Gimesia aquarii]
MFYKRFLLLLLFVIGSGVLLTEVSSSSITGEDVSAAEAATILGGATCYDWVSKRCERPNQTTCNRRLCWRWSTENPHGDYHVNGIWCCLNSSTPCDAVSTLRNTCNGS